MNSRSLIFTALSVFYFIPSFGMGQAHLQPRNAQAAPSSAAIPAASETAVPASATTDGRLDFLNSPSTPSSGNHVCAKTPVGALVKQTGWYFSAQGEIVIQKPSTPDESGVTHENYDLVLNFDFQAKDYSGAQKTQMQQEFHDFTANCYQQLSQFLIGPEGEHVTLRFPENDQEMRATPKASLIVKKDCGVRSNSDCWNATIGCATIWHETLHRLGLFDEYVEQNLGGAVHDAQNNLVTPGYNCRAIGPANSIMNNPTVALQNLYPTYALTVYKCPENASDSDNQACAAILDSVQQGGQAVSPVITNHSREIVGVSGVVQKPIGLSDPDVLKAYQSTLNPNLQAMTYYDVIGLTGLDPDTVSEFGDARLNGKRISPLRYEVTTKIPAVNKIALAPAEFTAILFPTCAINNLFYQCGQHATDSGSCGNRPAACAQGSSWTDLPNNQIP